MATANLNVTVNQLDALQKIVGEWGIETFPNSTRESIDEHLGEERAELHDAIRWETGAVPEEAADCLLLLLHLAYREGFSLFDAAVAKHRVNIGRTWDQDGGDKGYRKHVEPAT